MSYLRLDELCPSDRVRYGQKAVNLGIAGRHVPVPGGIVFDHGFVRRALEDESAESVLEPVWEHVRADAIAVRSSALDEDGVESNNAGRYESRIVGRDPREIRAAAGAVLRSIGDGGGGIIFQGAVEPAVSGTAVSFLNRYPAPLVVEASPGLCLDVTTGSVADRFLLSEVGVLLREEIAQKSAAHRLDGGTVRLVSLDWFEAGTSCLSRTRLSSVVDLRGDLIELFGRYLDIEWTIGRNGALSLLQVRRATT